MAVDKVRRGRMLYRPQFPSVSARCAAPLAPLVHLCHLARSQYVSQEDALQQLGAAPNAGNPWKSWFFLQPVSGLLWPPIVSHP